MFFILSFIQCSREKNNMSVISEVTLYCIPIYCVQHNIELDHLRKLMLNKKRKKVRIHNCCLFTSSVVPHMICYQMLQYSGAEKSIARLSGD